MANPHTELLAQLRTVTASRLDRRAETLANVIQHSHNRCHTPMAIREAAEVIKWHQATIDEIDSKPEVLDNDLVKDYYDEAKRDCGVVKQGIKVAYQIMKSR